MRPLVHASRDRGFLGRLRARRRIPARETRALPGGESEFRRALPAARSRASASAARAAAIEAAMIETERNLRLRYWNEF